MAFEEKTAWVYGLVSLIAYVIYVAIVGTLAAQGTPLPEIDYVPALLWTIGASIVINIVATIAIGVVTPRGRDQRDRDIYRFGEHVGNSFVVLGGIVALILALLMIPHFWIANALYLCFMLSAVSGTIAKLVAYRSGLPKW
ncbi:MAG: hypothetical protein H7226_08295 [Salinibacterium sp.]|nr:hypothetical protein [Salinibacterium sp.]